MTNRHIDIDFFEYNSPAEMQEQDKELANAAIEAMSGAYAPYSNFHVGAAVRLSNGIIVKGANQENAAFPSGLCAERTAMFAAGAQYPNEDILSIAVVGGLRGEVSDSITPPCGSCRQVMAQYQTKSGKDMSIILVGKEKIFKFNKVQDLLPLVFNTI